MPFRSRAQNEILLETYRSCSRSAYFPHLVELHNYPSTSSIEQKNCSFETLNKNVLKKLSYVIPRGLIEETLTVSRAQLNKPWTHYKSKWPNTFHWVVKWERRTASTTTTWPPSRWALHRRTTEWQIEHPLFRTSATSLTDPEPQGHWNSSLKYFYMTMTACLVMQTSTVSKLSRDFIGNRMVHSSKRHLESRGFQHYIYPQEKFKPWVGGIGISP